MATRVDSRSAVIILLDMNVAVVEEGPDANLRNEPRARTWNVISPDGKCFEEGRHTSVEFSLSDANKVAATWPWEECSADCDCREE